MSSEALIGPANITINSKKESTTYSCLNSINGVLKDNALQFYPDSCLQLDTQFKNSCLSVLSFPIKLHIVIISFSYPQVQDYFVFF